MKDMAVQFKLGSTVTLTRDEQTLYFSLFAVDGWWRCIICLIPGG